MHIFVKKDMRTLQLLNPNSTDYYKTKMIAATHTSDFKGLQILYMITCYHVNADYLSDITGYSKSNIYSIVKQHNHSTNKDISIQKKGGRKRSLLSIEQEQIFMKGLENKALLGQILSYLDVKKLVEEKVKKSVSDDFIWDLFKRNGWTKHSPRPHHPKKDIAAQEEFKKNSKSVWLPLKMILQMN